MVVAAVKIAEMCIRRKFSTHLCPLYVCAKAKEEERKADVRGGAVFLKIHYF